MSLFARILKPSASGLSPRRVQRCRDFGVVLALLAAPLAAGGDSLSWHAGDHHRCATLDVRLQDGVGFATLEPSATGLGFTNLLDELRGAANRVLYNGAGLAAGDYDGDGWPDLFFCNLSGANALFRNLGGWRFTNTTAEAGLGAPCPQSRGAVFADLDGDGSLDLLVSVTGRGVLTYLNDGRGRFTDATARAGTASRMASQTMTLADVDGNGTLDLYVANNRPDDIRDRGQARITVVNGRPVMAGLETNRFVFLNGRLEERGQADQLFLNDGAGRLQLVSWTDGAFLDESGRALPEPPLDWGLTATFRDLDGDLAPDLYVCNDYWTPDHLWMNDGQGRFRAAEPLALRKITASSMSVDIADIDRDGDADIFAVDMLSRYPHLRKRQMYAQMPRVQPVGPGDDRPQVVRNTLFLNRQDGTFAEIACYANVAASDWSWAPVFLDVDLDGYEDLLIGAGYFRDVQDYDAEAIIRSRQHPWTGFASEGARQGAFTRELMEHYRLYPTLQMPIGTWRNLGGCRFQETTGAWGLDEPGVHQGLALADFDLDGDLDLAVNNLNSPAQLYRNVSGAPRVAVRLRGAPPNTQGIGAKVSLLDGAIPRQSTEITSGGHYQSGFDPQVVFAAGAATNGMTIEVRWRRGTRSLVRDVRPNRLYEIAESGATLVPAPSPKPVAPLFEDVSHRLDHTHHEVEFDDYERQPLLPFKLSQLGPGVAWIDLDGDGRDEIVVGSGRGGRLAVFRNDGGGLFVRCDAQQAAAVANDTAGLVGWAPSPDAAAILTGTTGYEIPSDHGVEMARIVSGRLTASVPFALEMATGGALALGDCRGDGQLALFVAGGVVPGHYPVAARSGLYRLEGSQWKPDVRNSALLDNLGIVNGAVWSDLDGNGLPELVLACEWGPVRVFRSQGGVLHEATAELGLQPYTGWWRGVTTGDLNNDGRLDIIASNWGLNSPYRATAQAPLVFLYGQLAQPGVMDIVETEYQDGVLAPRRQFQALATVLPFLNEWFESHKAYSEARLEQVLGDRMVLARRVKVTTLASMAFLNTGSAFTPVELPAEAQFAPAFSVNVGDADGDGNEDVFLSQNFFDTQPETTRIDAGVGLWLRGDGTGKLEAVAPARSGIRIFGQQRGAALGDYDADGRVDLVVAQNGTTTRLFHNASALPGLRVRLAGPLTNPRGVGAVIRLQSRGRLGPAREIHAGSGYWSQDSPVHVMAAPEAPEALWIRWPGGQVTTTPLEAGLREVTVNLEGRLTSSR